LPDPEARRDLLRINLKDIEIAEDVNLDEIADKMEGFTFVILIYC
jgi:ATP-dependent 26S proteasome regulatory subunit